MSCEFKNISFSYPGKKVLKKINLKIEPGEITTILGPNGSGKTTLIKTLQNNKTDSGEILIDGKDVNDFSVEQIAQRRAILSQKTDLAFSFSVSQIIRMGRFPYADGEEEKLVDEMLGIFGLSQLKDSSYLKLSGGEQQRVNIARSVVQIWDATKDEKKYLLMDEPTSSLDVQFQVQLIKTLEKIKKKNIGVLLVLHDINLALSVSDKIVLLSNGKIHQKFTKPFSENAILQDIENVFKTKFEITKREKGIALNPFFSDD